MPDWTIWGLVLMVAWFVLSAVIEKLVVQDVETLVRTKLGILVERSCLALLPGSRFEAARTNIRSDVDLSTRYLASCLEEARTSKGSTLVIPSYARYVRELWGFVAGVPREWSRAGLNVLDVVDDLVKARPGSTRRLVTACAAFAFLLPVVGIFLTDSTLERMFFVGFATWFAGIAAIAATRRRRAGVGLLWTAEAIVTIVTALTCPTMEPSWRYGFVAAGAFTIITALLREVATQDWRRQFTVALMLLPVLSAGQLLTKATSTGTVQFDRLTSGGLWTLFVVVTVWRAIRGREDDSHAIHVRI